MGRTKWTRERLEEMEKWKRENGATNKQTADHFKVNAATYWGARQRLGSGKSKKSMTPPSTTFEVPASTQSARGRMQFFAASGSPDQILELVRGMQWQ